jgi:hypothetical protein
MEALAKTGRCCIVPAMEIKPESLQSFKELYKNEFGIELSDTETYQKATLLLDYVLLGMKPLEKIEDIND